MEISRLDFQSSYAYLLAAMELSEHAMQEEAAQHRRDFIRQMQQLHISRIIIPDTFLPYEHTRATLMLLQSLSAIEDTLMQAVPAHAQKGFSLNLPLLPQMQDKIAGKIAQHRQRYRATLDKERQTATGITHYIWSTEGDDKVRDSHARREGQVYDWNSTPFPGSEAGCRCTAAPLMEGMALPDDPPIEPVYPVETLIGLLAGVLTNSVPSALMSRHKPLMPLIF